MTFRTLARRSLCFHWRSHLGVVLGAAIGSATLIGALVVGDSVQESLREQVLERLGKITVTLDAGDRLFAAALAYDLGSYLPALPGVSGDSTGIKAILRVSATAVPGDGNARANRVSLHGIDRFFWHLAEHWPEGVTNLQSDEVLLNLSLAVRLGVKRGDEVLFRVRKPSSLSGDSPIARKDDRSTTLRLRVTAILGAKELGNFHLRASQDTPLTAFMDMDALATQLGVTGRANLILTSIGKQRSGPASPAEWLSYVRYRFHGWIPDSLPWNEENMPSLSRALQLAWRMEDLQAGLGQTPNGQGLELRTSRVFLDSATASAAIKPVDQRVIASFEQERRDVIVVVGGSRVVADDSLGEEANPQMMARTTNAQPILTYLATLLSAGTNTTPYSMVTAASAPWTPTDLRDDEINVSQWLAEDLQVKPGDEIALTYFDPESGARLAERTNTFRVRGIVPMEMPWADRTLMPDFPGIEKAESTSDWDAGFPLVHKIRVKDEDYWRKYRGTPKAFITLAAGQKMWRNRFGNLTAIRFPIPTNPPPATPKEGSTEARTVGQFPSSEGSGVGSHVEAFRAALEKKILANLKPEELGLRFEPVREQALKAAAESQDFGGLFLGFSFFLILAALLLMAMLFQFGLEQRAPEIGTLLALGFTPKQVRRLLLREGVALAFIGGVLGVVGGIFYAKGMLHGLTTIWRDAVGATGLSFHFTAQTLVIGLFASVVVSAVTISLTLRKFVKQPALELLVGEIQNGESEGPSPKAKIVAVAALLAALGLVGWTWVNGDTANVGAFFGAGALVLVAGLSFVSAWLGRLTSNGRADLPVGQDAQQRVPTERVTFGSLAVRGCARRRKRSLGTVAMLACGSFLIVSIGVFRLDANRDASKRSSGTGGFALIGETTMPVVQDLDSKSGRDFFALDEKDLVGVNFVPFRVREGDEASCLNLNRAQKPRLLGVKPELLTERSAFSFSKMMEGTYTKIHPWSLLSKTSVPDRAPVERDEIPAIGDANSIQWAMHKKVGDTLDYVDERGQPFKVRIVGAVANSILQGQLIIDEAEFVKRFPGESGYRMFLIDAPSNAVPRVSSILSRAMQDIGLELTPAAQRLAQFNAVQNTYLGTFQVLGGLGLLLGSVGLGIVVLRNVLERRGELAVLMAVGFRKATLQRLLWLENGALLAAGLVLGVIAAAVAVLPALLSPGAQLPYASLSVTLGAVLVNGALWTWAATQFAVRGDLLKALRDE